MLILVFLAPLVAIWTARLALSRDKNPWVWGGASFLLGLPWPDFSPPILGVVPVLFLLFFVRPAGQRSRPRENACSKCASPHSPGQNYCTKCGWDLSREYSPEGSDTVLASEMHQPQGASTATMERPAEQPATEEPAEAASPAKDQTNLAATVVEDTTEATAPAAELPAEGTLTEAPAPELGAESEPEPAQKPWGLPQPGPAPTAAVMTARGAALLSEGRLQEAIDQFTKAIALDPKHREAFERRAEAYTQQGRDERAEEDYRHIQALNAGS